MSERGKNPKEQRELEHYATIELLSNEELRDFATVFRRNNRMAPGSAELEIHETEQLARRFIEQQKDPDASVRFFSLREGGDLVATSRLKIYTDAESGEIRALLSHLTVSPEHRGKKLSTRLTEERISAAWEAGATHIEAHVAQDNITSLALKLREGFRVTGFMYYDKGKRFGRFEVTQSFTEAAPGDLPESASHQEVLLSETMTLDELLHSGWIGVALTGTRTHPRLEMRKM